MKDGSRGEKKLTTSDVYTPYMNFPLLLLLIGYTIPMIPAFAAWGYANAHDDETCGEGDWKLSVHQTYIGWGVAMTVATSLAFIMSVFPQKVREVAYAVLTVLVLLFDISWIVVTWISFGYSTSDCISSNRTYWDDMLALNIFLTVAIEIRPLLTVFMAGVFDGQ